MASAVFSTWNALPPIGPLAISYWLLLIAILLLFIDSTAAKLRPLVPMWIGLPILALVIVLIGNYLFPTEPAYLGSRFVYFDAATVADANPLIRAVQWGIGLAALPLCLATAGLIRSTWIPKVMYAWVFGIAVSGTVACLDFVGLTSFSLNLLGFENAGARQAGLTFHPNSLGISCAMALPIAMVGASRRPRIGTIFLALLIAGAFVSGSRAAQAGAVAGVLFTLLFVPSSRRVIVPLSLIGVGLGVALFLSTPDLFRDAAQILRFTEGSSGASDVGRSELAAQGVRDFVERPIIGIGLEYLLFAHSVPLQLAAAGGILLAVPMAVYFAAALIQGWRVGATIGDPARSYVAALAVWMGVGLVSNQLIDVFLYYPIAGIVAALSLQQARQLRLAAPLTA
ncbi:O-antigen ligase family protein [Microbacterium sp. ARD31]|uniref:O-antigen ligase family protein n=1 Tax=Microbacterium sp. ARD31 TaxID=2962576 RepID=UPI0028826879|nr:O-antigen ligase family protein [Microbacterium sp. ARD31]MDT0185736.1 O-antigen ligase family protein [Microbacterium sp. ARD31]